MEMQADAPEFVPTGVLTQTNIAERNLSSVDATSHGQQRSLNSVGPDFDKPIRALPASGLFCPVCAAGDWCAFHSVDGLDRASSNDGGSWSGGFYEGSHEDGESYSTTDYDDAETGTEGEKWAGVQRAWAVAGTVAVRTHALGPQHAQILQTPSNLVTGLHLAGMEDITPGASHCGGAPHCIEGQFLGAGTSPWSSPMWAAQPNLGQGPR
mmetsp:Transcript_10624/g.19281  ORF Transcript_10624/g.19281 Transcript_10624/m.19281 type:complete len:210 (+) Transcript_10624:97-726(+)